VSNNSPVREKDVSILSLYSASFVRINCPGQDGATKLIHLFSVANDQVDFILEIFMLFYVRSLKNVDHLAWARKREQGHVKEGRKWKR
jgi:hypothetical protein